MSTLKVDAIRHNSATSDAITTAADGTCTAKLTSVGGGQLSNRNIIINGAMNIAQRATSSTSGGGYNTVDRIDYRVSGADETPTQSQVDVASGTTPYTLGFRKAFRFTNGNQTGGAGAGDYLFLFYQVEAQDIVQSGWNYVSPTSFITLSFWVKSSVAQNFYGYIRSRENTEQSHSYETGTLSANTWTKVTKTFAGNSNIVMANDNGQGLGIYLAPFFGTDYTDNSKGTSAWSDYTNPTRTPDSTSTWWTTNDATFEITGLQLEVGDTATSFEHRSRGEELRRCQRYCVLKGYTNGTYDAMSTGAVWSTTLAFVPYFLPVEMRDTPSFTLVGSLSDFRYTRSGSEVTPGNLEFDQAGLSMMAVKLTGSSMTQNDAVRLYNINTNGGFLFTAEL